MKLIKFIIIILVFFTPLVFVINTEEGFEFPKMFFVYAVGTTLFTTYILGEIWKNKRVVRPTLIIQAFLLSQIISTIFSEHFYTSIWGYYSRFNGGLVSIFVFLGIYTVLINSLDENFSERIKNIITITILPIGTYAIFQHLTLGSSTRAYSTFGQPNWLGAYLAMILPLVTYKIIKAQKKETYVLTFIYLLGYTALWYTYSLSSMIGFFIGTATLVFVEKEKILQNIHKFSIISMLMLFISITQPGIYGQRIKDIFFDIRKVNAQETLVNDNQQLSDPGFIRLNIWKGSLNLAFSSPKIALIGTGPETFPYEFQKFRPQELNYSSEWNFILNKPHNFYIEVLVEEGIIGLISYITLIFWALKNTHSDIKSGLIAFLVTNLFGWPTVATSLIFWFFIANTRLKDTIEQDTLLESH